MTAVRRTFEGERKHTSASRVVVNRTPEHVEKQTWFLHESYGSKRSYRSPLRKAVISLDGGEPVTSSLLPVLAICEGGLPQTNERVAITVRAGRSITVSVQPSWMARAPISYRPTSCRA